MFRSPRAAAQAIRPAGAMRPVSDTVGMRLWGTCSKAPMSGAVPRVRTRASVEAAVKRRAGSAESMSGEPGAARIADPHMLRRRIRAAVQPHRIPGPESLLQGLVNGPKGRAQRPVRGVAALGRNMKLRGPPRPDRAAQQHRDPAQKKESPQHHPRANKITNTNLHADAP